MNIREERAEAAGLQARKGGYCEYEENKQRLELRLLLVLLLVLLLLLLLDLSHGLGNSFFTEKFDGLSVADDCELDTLGTRLDHFKEGLDSQSHCVFVRLGLLDVLLEKFKDCLVILTDCAGLLGEIK